MQKKGSHETSEKNCSRVHPVNFPHRLQDCLNCNVLAVICCVFFDAVSV
jgi:hypothetical protein